MTGIGEQRHRAAPQPCRHLDDNEAHVQGDRHGKGPARTGNAVLVIVMIVVVVAMAAVVVNPRSMMMRAAHSGPFRATVAQLPQCSKNRYRRAL
ncbi:hypothetical protein GCM10023306_28230 [Novosphingobium ginsenosidimutans]